MERLEELAELLASQLQWPAAETDAEAAFSTAKDFYDTCITLQEADELESVDATGAFLALSSRLGSLAVALKKQPAGAALTADPSAAFCLQASAACLALNALLQCVEDWSEGEWLRLLTAAVIPLEVLPPILFMRVGLAVAPTPEAAAAVAAAGSADFGGSTRIKCLDGQLQCMSAAFNSVIYKLLGDEEAVPERVRRAVRAAQFKPARLLAWVRCVAQTATILRAAGGRGATAYLQVLLFMLLHTEKADLPAQLAADVAAQRELLQLTDTWLLLPAGDLAAAVADPGACGDMGAAVQLASADCLREARQRREVYIASSNGRHTKNLVQSVASLAALPQLMGSRDSVDQAGLLIAVHGLLATLVRDASSYQQAWGQAVPAQYVNLLLQQLGGPGGLPLLCQLAAEVAAAGEAAGAALAAGSAAPAAEGSALPASPGSRDSGSDSGSGSGSGSDSDSDSSGASFGSRCWRPLEGGFWGSLLATWVVTFQALTAAPIWATRLDASSAVAALRAAEALLRLAALSPCQPAERTAADGGWRDAAQVAAAAGGASNTKLAVCLLGQAALELASPLLRAPLSAPAGVKTAAAVFAALVSTSRCLHAASAAAISMQHSSGGGDSAAVAVFGLLPLAPGGSFTLLGAVFHETLLTFHMIQCRRVGAAAAGEQREHAVRHLECGMLLFLAAIKGHEDCTLVGPESSCNWLSMQLKEAALAPLWRQLLGPGGGDGDVAAAAGMDVPLLMADLAVVTLEAAVAAPATPGTPRTLGDFEQCKAALSMLKLAVELEPQLSARLADHSVLLRMLSQAGAVLLEERRTQEVRLLTSTLCALLRQLALHLPAAMTDRLAGLRPAGNVQRSTAALDSLGRYADALIAAGPAAESQQQQSRSRRRHPLGADAQQLAVRRAQALACCAGCANPRCSNLNGVSEAAARGKLCSVCRTVRFCSPACSKEEWAQHKWACKLLGAART